MSVEGLKSLFDIATVVLLGLTFFAGAGVLITGNIINRRQDAKLRVFDHDLTAAKTSLATQQERAAKAEANIALAEQHSAEANAKAERFRLAIATANESAAKAIESAEQEKLARVNIELRLAWRHIGPKLHDAAVATLKPHKGSRVNITLVGGDPETIGFLGEIESIFKEAEWRSEVDQVVNGDHGISGLLCDIDERTAAGRSLNDVCSSLGATVRKMRLTDEIGVVWVSAKPPA